MINPNIDVRQTTKKFSSDLWRIHSEFSATVIPASVATLRKERECEGFEGFQKFQDAGRIPALRMESHGVTLDCGGLHLNSRERQVQHLLRVNDSVEFELGTMYVSPLEVVSAQTNADSGERHSGLCVAVI